MPTANHRRASALGLATTLVLPGVASAATLTPVAVFQNAAHPVQAIALSLILATVAAMVICGVKLSTGPALSGGSAYLSGLRVGGPLAGLLGASLTILIMFLYISNTPAPVTLSQTAPGIAEAMMLVVLGLASGAVAVIAKWAVDARIDRAVLKS